MQNINDIKENEKSSSIAQSTIGRGK